MVNTGVTHYYFTKCPYPHGNPEETPFSGCAGVNKTPVLESSAVLRHGCSEPSMLCPHQTSLPHPPSLVWGRLALKGRMPCSVAALVWRRKGWPACSQALGSCATWPRVGAAEVSFLFFLSWSGWIWLGGRALTHHDAGRSVTAADAPSWQPGSSGNRGDGEGDPGREDVQLTGERMPGEPTVPPSAQDRDRWMSLGRGPSQGPLLTNSETCLGWGSGYLSL